MIIHNLEDGIIEITISKVYEDRQMDGNLPLIKFAVPPHNELQVSVDGPEDGPNVFQKGSAMLVESTGAWKLVTRPPRWP